MRETGAPAIRAEIVFELARHGRDLILKVQEGRKTPRRKNLPEAASPERKKKAAFDEARPSTYVKTLREQPLGITGAKPVDAIGAESIAETLKTLAPPAWHRFFAALLVLCP